MRKFGKIVHCVVAAALLMEMIISFRFGSLLCQGKKPHHIIGLYVCKIRSPLAPDKLISNLLFFSRKQASISVNSFTKYRFLSLQ